MPCRHPAARSAASVKPSTPCRPPRGRSPSPWLAQFGVAPQKSLTLEFPTNIPADRIRDFVRGVIDGDGSIWIHNYRQVKGGETVYEYQYPCVAVSLASRPFLILQR